MLEVALQIISTIFSQVIVKYVYFDNNLLCLIALDKSTCYRNSVLKCISCRLWSESDFDKMVLEKKKVCSAYTICLCQPVLIIRPVLTAEFRATTMPKPGLEPSTHNPRNRRYNHLATTGLEWSFEKGMEDYVCSFFGRCFAISSYFFFSETYAFSISKTHNR